MSSKTAPNGIVLYNYDFSPYGKRVSAYLALRGIDYALCEQPNTMPRPDLALLNVNYRRIPVLTIGRDVYLDTRLQLRALEALPNVSGPRLGATNPSDLFIEKLLEKYMIEGPPFAMAAGLVPLELALDEKFNKDRKGMLGKTWKKEDLVEEKGECANYMRNVFDFLEKTLFADGRKWVLGADGPKLADIEAAFMLDFTNVLAVPDGLITARIFPKVFAWLDRYGTAIEKAKSSAQAPTDLDGQSAADVVLRSDFGQLKLSVDPNDPTGMKEGTEVEVYPADWLTEHKERGRLLGLTADEVTIAVGSKKDTEIRVHAPRTDFKIRETRKN